jgi:hypothetical protein
VTDYDAAAFDSFEAAGWEIAAAGYDFFTATTSQSAQPLLAAVTAFLEGTVRVGGMLRAASMEQRDRIRAHVEGAMSSYRDGGSYTVSAPVKIAAGEKAA